jgi:hypothetical protein
MSSDELGRKLTLELAMRARRIHAPANGWCQHCLAGWPCDAAQRIELAIKALERPLRAVGVARVHPNWSGGQAGAGEFRWL